MKLENDKQLIPYFILENYFKNKYSLILKKSDEFIDYMSSYFDVKKEKVSNRKGRFFQPDGSTIFEIELDENKYYSISFLPNGDIKLYLYKIDKSESYFEAKADVKSKMFKRAEKTKEFAELLKNMQDIPIRHEKNLQTNSDNVLGIEFDDPSAIYFKLYHKKDDANAIPYSYRAKPFYYNCITVNGDKHWFDNQKYTEEEVVKELSMLKVDISSFSKEEQEKINQFYIANMLNLEQANEEKAKEFREIQINRIMLAYQKFKEIAELLNDTKMDLNFDRIKMDNLATIIFKNNGNPTEKGYIEFDDFFKNNMVLRMLDLSELDLTNVNITNMDFSGTNVHIDPQSIYNRDMSGVNATGVHFSPFNDSFDNVTLDGALINDREAMIDYNNLESYDDNTIVKKENISKMGR